MSENMAQSCLSPWVLQCARRVPSRWKPAFSIARTEAWLSTAASATTRARPSSRSPQSAPSRNAFAATPRPRASGKTETAKLATSSSLSNCRLRSPRGRSSPASAITNGALVPVDHCSSTRSTLFCRRFVSRGSSFSRRCVSGSYDARAIAATSASRRNRRTISPSLSGGSGGINRVLVTAETLSESSSSSAASGAIPEHWSSRPLTLLNAASAVGADASARRMTLSLSARTSKPSSPIPTLSAPLAPAGRRDRPEDAAESRTP
jgi:hypothetical protein